MQSITLHGGGELGDAAGLTAALLADARRVLLAPLARPDAEWEEAGAQARAALGPRVALADPEQVIDQIASSEIVLIPGGCPGTAAARVRRALADALRRTSIVAASAGAMLLGELMASSCPDDGQPCALVPGLGLLPGVVTPHVEALPPDWLAALTVLVGQRRWWQVPTGQAVRVSPVPSRQP